MKVKSEWPRKLRILRAKLGLTQVEAAECLGVDTRSWRRWECKGITPSPTMQKLLRLLEKYPHEFLRNSLYEG